MALRVIKDILLVCLVLGLSYAAGLMHGVSPQGVLDRLDNRIVEPLATHLFGAGPELADYTEISFPANDAISIAYFGQSNATNTVEPKATIAIPENLIQYEWKTSKCYVYQEPLLGADFTRGNVLTMLQPISHRAWTARSSSFRSALAHLLHWNGHTGKEQSNTKSY